MPSLDLKSLNKQQYAAVTAPLGPVLVLAGAGSGKTRVLAYRIGYLVEEGFIAPEHILALTFTNKAAKEMRTRVQTLLGNQLEQTTDNRQQTTAFGLPTLSTFHSLGVRMLRQHGYLLGLPKVFAILDYEDQLRLLKEVFAEKDIDESLKPQAVLHFIHTVKNTGFEPEAVASEYRGYMAQQFLSCYAAYQAALYRQGSVDLDDLIVLPVKLLSEFPEVRAYYHNRFRYILVDEYQDTNPIQYQFLRLLSPPAPLFVVGDDAQAIYGFRGSDITNILNFERDFPSGQVIVLDQNYRSTQNILAVADVVLKHSTEQKPKTLWTENISGQKVVVKELGTEVDEADFVVRSIVEAVSKGVVLEAGEVSEAVEIEDEADERPFSVLEYMLGQKNSRKYKVESIKSFVRLPEQHEPLREFAVLYRTHAQSRALEEAFLAAGVPYRIVGGVRFYDRKEIKDALSYIRLLVNLRDGVALSRACSVPPKGIGDKTAAALKNAVLTTAAESAGQDTDDFVEVNAQLCSHVLESFVGEVGAAKAKTSVKIFLSQISSWLAIPTDFALSDVVTRVIKESGLIKLYTDGTEAGDARVENLHELVSVAAKFSGRSWVETLPEFLEEIALVSDLDAASETMDAVTLMTLHSAKGLEFDTVFFVGLEEGLLPHSRSMLDPKAFAEEVRLAYVGITRARHQLYITYTRQRGLFGESRLSVPSRLLRNLPESAVTLHGRPRWIDESNPLSDGGVEYEPFMD